MEKKPKLYYAKIEYTVKSIKSKHSYKHSINLVLKEGVREYELLEKILSRTSHGKTKKVLNPVIVDKIELSKPKSFGKFLSGYSRR